MKTYEQIKEYIQNILSEKRFYHSECVANRCIELAKRKWNKTRRNRTKKHEITTRYNRSKNM